MSPRELMIESLGSSVCPACNGAKTPRMTFCRKDYYALPKDMRQAMRQALYHRFGNGYEQAFHAALTFLQTAQPATAPQDATPPPPEPQTTLFRDEGGAQWTL